MGSGEAWDWERRGIGGLGNLFDWDRPGIGKGVGTVGRDQKFYLFMWQ